MEEFWSPIKKSDFWKGFLNSFKECSTQSVEEGVPKQSSRQTFFLKKKRLPRRERVTGKKKPVRFEIGDFGESRNPIFPKIGFLNFISMIGTSQKREKKPVRFEIGESRNPIFPKIGFLNFISMIGTSQKREKKPVRFEIGDFGESRNPIFPKIGFLNSFISMIGTSQKREKKPVRFEIGDFGESSDFWKKSDF